MRLSQWLMTAFLGSGVVFASEALWGLYSPSEIFPPRTLLLAAAYCLIYALLLGWSLSIHRSVMTIVGLAILAAFVIRLLVLTIDDTLFAFPYLLTLSSDMVEHALWFMLGGTMAFWLGVKLAARKARWLRITGTGETYFSPLFRYRRFLILAGLAMTSLRLYISLTFSFQWYVSRWAFLERLLPVDAMVFVLIYLAVRDWKGLTLTDKLASITVFVAHSSANFSLGQRGALFHVAIFWLIVMVLVHGDPKISFTWVAGASLLALLIVPLYLGLVVAVREAVYIGVSALAALTFQDISLSLLAVMWTYSNALQGFDALVAVMNYLPGGIEPYLTLGALAKSIAGRLVPEMVWPSDVPSLGRLFGGFYQFPGKHELIEGHAGAWFGFGVFYAYFGPYGAVAMGGLGAILVMVSRKFSSGGLLSEPLLGYFLYTLCFMVFMSGNLDAMLSAFLIDAVLVSLMGWIMFMMRTAAISASQGPWP